ncbi:MAG: hypothetical protein M1814_000583 [Vezdaea aestivalis]|nr:MAG: hypothetical protein M1814_000583 [Vezdaea aestivalis]
MRDDARLFDLMNSLLHHLGLNPMTVDPKWLGLYELKARNLRDYGKAKDTLLLMKQIVRIKEQTLAEDHHNLLASQLALAIMYRDNGRVQEAVSLTEHVTKINKQSLVKGHPHRLESQCQLAMAYRASGQIKQGGVTTGACGQDP